MSGGQNIYVTGFGVLLVCSPLSGQRIDFVKTMCWVDGCSIKVRLVVEWSV